MITFFVNNFFSCFLVFSYNKLKWSVGVTNFNDKVFLPDNILFH